MDSWKEKLDEFLYNDVGYIVITDSTGKFVENDHTTKLQLSDKGKKAWDICVPEAYDGQRGEVWELSDNGYKRYYSVTTSAVRTDEGLFQLHQLVDVTNYSELFRKLTQLYREWEILSKFQNSALEKLSNGYDMILPDIARILDAQIVYLRVKTNLFAEEIIYYVNDRDIRKIVHRDMNINIDIEEGEYEDDMLCILSRNAEDQQYVMLIKQNNKDDVSKLENMLMINAIHMFVVNVLLRMQIIYNSEHDALTGLYNKGKYMKLLEKEFGRPDSIAVFNMDVNFLKKANDTFGHEKGDELIVKAAKSILMIEGDDVLGFRMGGDEYMVIALNKTMAEVDEIKHNWEKAVEKINREDNDIIPLVIACGVTYGSGDYDLSWLIQEADKRMYMDKKMKKGEDISAS